MDQAQRTSQDFMISAISQPAWESAPAMFYGGAFDVAVICRDRRYSAIAGIYSAI